MHLHVSAALRALKIAQVLAALVDCESVVTIGTMGKATDDSFALGMAFKAALSCGSMSELGNVCADVEYIAASAFMSLLAFAIGSTSGCKTNVHFSPGGSR